MKSPGLRIPLLALALVLLFSSCQEEEIIIPNDQTNLITNGYSGVDARLWAIFDKFEAEGRARGFIIDLEARGVTGSISEILDNHVAGQCTYNTVDVHHITIDETFWNNSPDLYREMIVFHELGHCYLYQDHREGVFTDGICASIMRSGITGCRDNYNLVTRPYYLDELFFEGVPVSKAGP